GLERAWRQVLRRVSRPEAVAIAAHRDEPLDAAFAYEVVELGALAIRRADVAAAHGRVARDGPGRFGDAGGQVLRVHAPVERSVRRAPDLPCRLRRRERALEPCLLLFPQHRERGLVATEIGDGRFAEGDRVGWLS